MRDFLFNFLHTLATKHAFPVVIVSLLAAAGLGIYGAVTMEMVTDQDRLLSEDLPYHHRYLDFIKRFGDLEYLFVVVEGGSDEEKIRFADRLAGYLQQSEHIKDVIYKYDRMWAKPFALYYAPLDDIRNLHVELTSQKNEFEQLVTVRNFDHILHEISSGLSEAERNPSAGVQSSTEQLSAVIQALQGEAEPSLQDFNRFERELDEEFSEPFEYQWWADREFLVMYVMPSKDYSTLSVVEEPIKEIRAAIALTHSEFPNVKAGLTGRPALQADEMSTTNRDMMRSSLLALVAVVVLFSAFFRELVRPAVTVLALLMAMGWTYGFVALTLGHLNLLSLVFALVLIGLGIDFGIHFLHRYQEELEKSKNPSLAVLGALHGAGSGIVTGAVTSSVAFLAALFTDFLGLAELGYVAGVGILFCLVTMLLTLPAMLYMFDRHFRKSEHTPTPVHLAGLRHVSSRPVIMVLCIMVVTAAMFPNALHIRFNDNLLELQAEGLESVEYEHKLLEETDQSTWFCAFLRDDLQSVIDTTERLMTKETVSKVLSIVDILPSNPGDTAKLLREVYDVAKPFEENVVEPYQPNVYIYTELRQKIDRLFAGVERQKQLMEQVHSGAIEISQLPPEQQSMLQQVQSNPVDASSIEPLRELRTLLDGDAEEVERRLLSANALLLEQPKRALHAVAQYARSAPPVVGDLPEQLRKQYIGKQGSYLVMAFPRYNVWDTQQMKAFIGDVRSVDPDVTGTPVQVYESSMLMRDSFVLVGWMSLVAVTVLVFLDFLSLKALLFTIGPLVVGVLWLVELMGTFNVNLNLANFFAIPILIGIGVDNAVHFYHRFLESRDVEKAMFTTGTTLTLTTMTTIAGFGSLMFASHKGLASLGALMALGSSTCWFACVVFMPALIKILHRK